MTVALAAVGAVAAVVGTVGSLGYQARSLALSKKALVKDRQAGKKLQLQQDLQTRYATRQSIREMQLNRARALMSSVGAGSFFSSGAQGGIGGLSSQLGAGLGFQSQYNNLSQDISHLGSQSNRFTGLANLYSSRANLMSGIASLGGTVFQSVGGFRAFAPAPTTPILPPIEYTPTYTTPTRAAVPNEYTALGGGR